MDYFYDFIEKAREGNDLAQISVLKISMIRYLFLTLPSVYFAQPNISIIIINWSGMKKVINNSDLIINTSS